MRRESPIEQEHRLLQELAAAVARRAAEEENAERTLVQAQTSAEREAEAAQRAIDAALQTELSRAKREWETASRAVQHDHETRRRAIESACAASVERISRELSLADQKAAQIHKEARWLARTVYEAQSKRLVEQATKMQRKLQGQQQSVRQLGEQATGWIAELGFTLPPSQAVAASTTENGEGKLADRIAARLQDASAQLESLRSLRLPRLARGGGFFTVFTLLAAVIVPALYFVTGGEPLRWGIASLIAVGALGTIACVWLRITARRQLAVGYEALSQTLVECGDLCRQALQQTAAEAKRRKRKLREQRDAENAKHDHAKAVVVSESNRRREAELPRLRLDADEQLLALEAQASLELRTLEHRRLTVAATEQERAVAARANVQATLQKQLATATTQYETSLAEGAAQWHLAQSKVNAETIALEAELNAVSPDWASLLSALPSPRAFPRGVRLGRLHGETPNTPQAAEFAAQHAQGAPVSLPAALCFPDAVSLLVKSDASGRGAAVNLLQTTMLRLLTSLPPGKVRFTIIDPTGLGENFASFMHLADFEELLVNHRIWTEPAQIERKLAEITEHMETVIQKYLRNEYASIHDYNEQAGEIAEPLRVIVVAGFPTAFTEAAARRLLSIAANGPRCGVHVLLSADMRAAKSSIIDVSEFERHAQVFTCQGERLVWQHPAFKSLEFTLDAAPVELVKPLLQAAGQAAVSMRRVEVPFEAITPAPADVWKFDSRRGIDVPLGRSGATRLQSLRLGEGTSQHVLIAGKTGSGKSTLLHALITNAALRYAPTELQLYLIDFKKGVEFKSYVTRHLPHARVVAIESEREFGLSVMQRLDVEMRRRGEQFRAAGVQDIAGFRDAGHELPRVLFIVDEFQEFFVQDDKVAQDAALLLDRLVRQGRAFGIHVILGSQTLSGAYGLARSTLGQMAVRIALQCNESDAQVILSEDNAAARLLTRPGEAIYNDANGLVEGNHLFQVVWASDERREHYLEQMAELAAERSLALPTPIIFEGAQPADLAHCAAVQHALAERVPVDAPPRLWLGEPLAIEDATQVTLPRRGGANLLWIGQNDLAAAGMMTAAILTMLARPDNRGGLCTLLHAGSLDADFSATLRLFTQSFPERLEVHGAGDCAAVMAEFAAELDRRRANDAPLAPRLLIVHDLARLRPLRKKEDEFSFSRSTSDVPRPDKQFLDLLREGPALGLHVLVWCDTLANFQRTLDRQTLKEFDARVILQMSAADSSLLTDSAAGSQLGPHRAILQREDHGVLEKFRPFTQPSETWLEETCRELSTRTDLEPAANPALLPS
jgi:S-DNA-T family DNA segregation ATPase FtsK/SpoIIIE